MTGNDHRRRGPRTLDRVHAEPADGHVAGAHEERASRVVEGGHLVHVDVEQAELVGAPQRQCLCHVSGDLADPQVDARHRGRPHAHAARQAAADGPDLQPRERPQSVADHHAGRLTGRGDHVPRHDRDQAAAGALGVDTGRRLALDGVDDQVLELAGRGGPHPEPHRVARSPAPHGEPLDPDVSTDEVQHDHVPRSRRRGTQRERGTVGPDGQALAVGPRDQPGRQVEDPARHDPGLVVTGGRGLEPCLRGGPRGGQVGGVELAHRHGDTSSGWAMVSASSSPVPTSV